jgi:hypothetical protein
MTSGDYPGGTGGWASVIYSKTYRVDKWWRARPASVTPDGRAAGVIAGAVRDGRFPAPRFVLARLEAGTLAGVACAASQFGTEYAADFQGRPLYGFVGWYCEDPRVTVPTLDELKRDWERLVRNAYDRVMEKVWLLSAYEAGEPMISEPGEAPWPAPSGQRLPDLPADLSDVRAPDGDTIWVYPSRNAQLVWQAVADYGARAAVVTGWQAYKSAIQPYLTHVCAEDVSGRFPMTAPRPTRDDRAAGGSGLGDRVTTTGYQPAGTGMQPGYQPAGGGTQSAAGYERNADKEVASSGGGVLGRLRDIGDGVKKVYSEVVSGGDDGTPPPPPDWTNAWTFRPPATFGAIDGRYSYWYVIGEQTIHCMDQRSGQRLDWTGSAWVPAGAPRPAFQSQTSPGVPRHGTTPVRAPGGHSPGNPPYSDQPTGADLETVTPQELTEEKRQKMNTAFGGFGRSARDRDAARGIDTAAGTANQEGSAETGTEPGDSDS